jgi:nitrilase
MPGRAGGCKVIGMIAAAAQIEPVLFDRKSSLEKAEMWAQRAADSGAKLVAFGESLVPAYPFWLSPMGGAKFESDEMKGIHADLLREGVDIEAGHLSGLQKLARDRGVMIVIGVAERPADRAGQTLYCTAVTIDAQGEIASAHRKLMPTYEERLAWGIGDGHGLRVHDHEDFRVGSLNCWENWMPLARASLQAQGETLHVMIWPGGQRLTQDITRFAAREGRSFVVSASGLIRQSSLPERFKGRVGEGEFLYNGGSCIAGPNGEFIVPPVIDQETLVMAELDPAEVRRERQNFDPSGHYARPDVLRLHINRERQKPITIEE